MVWVCVTDHKVGNLCRIDGGLEAALYCTNIKEHVWSDLKRKVETVSASTTWNGDFTGHFHIWGGGIDQNSATQFWGYHQKYTIPIHRDLPNGAVLCAEGWEHVGGPWRISLLHKYAAVPPVIPDHIKTGGVMTETRRRKKAVANIKNHRLYDKRARFKNCRSHYRHKESNHIGSTDTNPVRELSVRIQLPFPTTHRA
ncbi:uncharacterized protein VTP21DRAFT_1943 [Calcarisporiella thermophila]|uniref:uncharacterized protein n=1 Tax=Calcarisporiella thermophila TaxID=911321 RepID=UPI003742C21E